MEQREVRDEEGTTWTCVQAYGGIEGKNGERAEKLSEDENSKVEVVCTPNGGAKTVRLKLNKDWFERMDDEELLEQIEDAHEDQG